MGGPATSNTDYTPQQVIEARYQQAVNRGDNQYVEVIKITVAFDPNFDEFAARTAYELRTRLYYRHDGGKNARGLVRATGDLAVIHKLFATVTPPLGKGTPIHLNAILGRRQDPQANMRWVMVIRFNNSEDFVEGEEIVVTANRASVAEKMMKTVIHHIMNDPKLPGERGKRIREMATIADKLGYPKNWDDLWFYERGAVVEYVDYQRTGDKRRQEMTRGTQGNLPFDGDIPLSGGSWRVYPFRQAATECARFGNQNADDCQGRVHNIMRHAEDEMLRTFEDVNRIVQKVGFLNGMDPHLTTDHSLDIFGPLAAAFIKHLVKLSNTPDTLYSTYIKFPN